MRQLSSAFSSLQIRNLASRYISSSSKSQLYLNFPKPPISSPQYSLTIPYFSLPRHFSSASLDQNDDELAKSLSNELLKDQKLESLPLSQRLDLKVKSFSHFTPSYSLIKSVLNSCPDAGRNVLEFRDWVSKKPNFVADDDTYASFIDYFGRKGDFKAFDEVLAGGRGVTGLKTMTAYVDRLVRAKRPSEAVSFFEKMDVDYGFVRDQESLRIVVEKLCDNGHWHIAEKMVKSLASEFSHDEYLCDLLIKGWCLDGKLDQAKRVAEDMRARGFKVGTNAYNAMLEYVCKLCRQKDHCRLQGEAEKVLIDMDSAGAPFNADTYKILIEIFCRLERVEYAMSVFAKMKEHDFKAGVPTYDALIGKLVAHGHVDRATALFNEAASAGVKVVPKAYKIYPQFALKKETGWQSLPLKMARKAQREERKKKKQKPNRRAI